MNHSNGWVKLHRQILEWEWYDDHNTFRLFIYLLLKANHKDRSYKGMLIETGCLITGRKELAMSTGLSEQQIRTSLSKLKSTNEITIETNSKGTKIQIVNYKDYQQVTNESTNNQPSDYQQVTTNKNVNNDNNEKKEEEVELIFEPSKKLLFDKWLEYRRQIKKPITAKSTLTHLANRFNKESLEKITFVVNTSIENNWQGLFWDKYTEPKSNNPQKPRVAL